MYKLLIVDDEFIVIDGLKKLVDWNKYNIRPVGEAANGNEGIALAREKNPDIVITDIKMPGMNGLDMIKCIKDINPKVKFLVFSGHDNFDWVKRAFNYGVEDYLLKPIDLAQLDAVLNKIISEIEIDRVQAKDQEKAKKILNKSMEALKKEALTELFTGQYSSIEAVEEKLLDLNIKLGGQPFAVMLFKIKHKCENDGEDDGNAIAREILAKILSFLEKESFGYGIFLEKTTVVFSLTAPGTDSRWSRILAQYLDMKFMLDKYDISIGVGGTYEQLNRAKISFIEAEQAIQYNYLLGNSVTCYSDIRTERIKFEKLDYPELLEKTIIDGLKLVQRESVQTAINQFFDEVRRKKFEMIYFKNIITELLFLIKKNLNNINIDLSKIFIDEYEEIYNVQKVNTLEDIRNILFQFTGRIMNYIENTANKSNKQIVHEILNYINENFTSNNISLNKIAECFYLTPNYISALIKQETGDNFSDIVVKKRIELAKELLFDVTSKTYEISEKVGYSNPNYFTRTFKKLVGMSPGEFRDKFCK